MILPQLQEALVVASDQMVARRRRRTQRFRLGLLTSAAVVSLGGGAVASQSLWAPLLGWEDGNRPSVSRQAAPTAQAEVLGVLRREQTAVDRGPVGRAALRRLTGRYVGVKVSSLRVLPDAFGTSSVLLPVSTVRGTTQGVATTSNGDALCLHVAYDASMQSGARRCFTTAELRSGAAVLPAGETIRGVVPDGVARVRFSGGSGPPRDVPVTSNVFVTPLNTVPGATRLSWLSARGEAIPFPTGATSRDVAVPVVRAVIPATMHDCGKALGGVVPKRLRCGAPSRSYRPAIGAVQYPSQKP
jgi:hypothetical protein